ncbi:DUF1641 domain-containing protein [Staphylococcus saprophyticus]|uniref:DUF1641 domain-containing protein n=1 Tax=Staphylococcus saprophyticus TaxID=29385 RepID=UPI0022EA5A3F|nr:hypothetical protein [Staphylococcus saprophyticus]
MAKATKIIHKQEVDPEIKHAQEVKELEQQLLEHKDSLYEVLSILEKMKDHKLLEMMDAGLGQSEDIIHRLVMAVQETNASRSIKNMLMVVQLLGTIDMEELEPIVLKFNKGIENAGEFEHGKGHGGYLSLISTLRDPQVIEGTNVVLRIVKGLGTDVNEEKKTESQPKQHEEKKERAWKEQESAQKKSIRWYVFMGGATIALTSLLIKK